MKIFNINTGTLGYQNKYLSEDIISDFIFKIENCNIKEHFQGSFILVFNPALHFSGKLKVESLIINGLISPTKDFTLFSCSDSIITDYKSVRQFKIAEI